MKRPLKVLPNFSYKICNFGILLLSDFCRDILKMRLYMGSVWKNAPIPTIFNSVHLLSKNVSVPNFIKIPKKFRLGERAQTDGQPSLDRFKIVFGIKGGFTSSLSRYYTRPRKLNTSCTTSGVRCRDTIGFHSCKL